MPSAIRVTAAQERVFDQARRRFIASLRRIDADSSLIAAAESVRAEPRRASDRQGRAAASKGLKRGRGAARAAS